MKGYKKFLKIVCHESKNGKRFYYGYVNMGLFNKIEKLVRRQELNNFSGYYLSSRPYILSSPVNNFNSCKKELRECFLEKIKRIKFERGHETKRKFKIWP